MQLLMLQANGEGSNLVWAALMSVLNFIVWIFTVIKKSVGGLFSSSSETPASSSLTDRYVRIMLGFSQFVCLH